MNNTILLVFEGEQTEPAFFNSLRDIFLMKYRRNAVIHAIYGGEIYQLWREVKKDPDLEIIGLLKDKRKQELAHIKRSDVSEVYLFFDHDGHSHPEVDDYQQLIQEMISFFSEETENGRIYISYPMVESVKVCSNDLSKCLQCLAYVDDNTAFKHNAAMLSEFNDCRDLTEKDWHFVFSFSLIKAKRLVLGNYDFTVSNSEYSQLTQNAIALKQSNYFSITPKRVVVLSGIVFFLIDYCGAQLLQLISDTISQKYCSFACIPTIQNDSNV